ncbi:MAG: YihY/virulence factor BrkB family protein [Chloroflexi bacterium]|nr:MAG: YihY/virulence factor BrkB family protein [Chloroflexota bacterium]
MSELRQASAPSLQRARAPLQGIRLVQDGQPRSRQERVEVGFAQERDEDGDEDRDQERNEDRDQVRRKTGQARAEERGRILRGGLARVRRIVQSFGADECPFLAAAVAYQLFFALIPLLALVVGVLAFVYGPDQAQREIVEMIRTIYPSATAQETRIARELVQGRALSLGLGAVGTVFSATAIYGSLETALAAVLGREGRRGFIRDKAQAAGVRLALQVGSPILGALVGYAFFYLVYRTVPRRRPPRRVAVQAALVSAVLWEVAKLAFGFFTRGLGTFTSYGPLAFAAGLLTWIYLTAIIILVGAEVIKTRGAA